MTTQQTIVANSGSITQINENFRGVGPAALYGINPASTTGLTFGFYGGEFNGVSVANGTVALTASNTNYVVANRTTGAVTASTATTDWNDTANYLRLYQFVAGASTFTIASTSDKRQAFGGSASGSGLSNWTESVSTAAPNATTYAVRFLTTGGVTNIDSVLSPKGNGAVLGQTPDSLSAGGNKRGTYATDWQRTRSAASQVASGSGATIPGGAGNTAAGSYSFACGQTSSAGGFCAFGYGSSANASADHAVALGQGAQASGVGAVAIGEGTLADGLNSLAAGKQSSTKGMTGAFAYAASNLSVVGDAQGRSYVLRASTTNATTTRLTANGGAASATNQPNLPSGDTHCFEFKVAAKKTTTGDAAGWTIVGTIKNVSGTVSLVGTPTVTSTGADAGASGWTVAVIADNTNKCIAINVTGGASDSIRWVAYGEASEVN